jgi:NADH-quinone oxidoreductase subunit M
MMIAGVVSEVYGALMALAEQDIKRIIAYSSVSQMGYILFGLGTLTFDGLAGATLHVIYHAIAKALLFMCVGLIAHATQERDIENLGGLAKALPLTAFCTGIGALTIAGTPPFAVFDSEWLIFAGGFETAHLALSILTLFGSLLTVAYALWFAGRVFLGSQPKGLSAYRAPWTMLGPALFLSVLALVEGIFPAPVFNWVAQGLNLVLGGQW